MKRITILGSSGSIGTQTLDAISLMKGMVKVDGLAVGKNIKLLKQQIKKFKPKAVSVSSVLEVVKLKKWSKTNNINVKVYSGREGLIKLATMSSISLVVAAVVGAAGLDSTIAAIRAKKDIAIANKETLVMAGDYIMKLASKLNVKVLPVDSEHSAIFQCCNVGKKSQIKKIILTASGGPFYKYVGDLSKITVSQALNHPTWKMGKKISVDSATLMNKGLEAIEASVLFGIPIEKVEIVIHPQSIVHSMVEYLDGSVIAQLSNPDMTLPIQYALTYPERICSKIKSLNLCEIGKLEFYEPDFNKFPCLSLAYFSAKKGYTMPAVMNAANEVCVDAFLSGNIKFTDIAKIVKKAILSHKILKNKSVDTFIKADAWSRDYVSNLIKKGIL
ncbi:MAG: 1-deoxy-D-xylulose-5-phosphate reductoisomerase [Endomicrobium sp.]|jgi:1-deoxy-D-xylulose-5-phosphate reductoisomerase|nr:1-deoxy-D-xylulose-5-phosphate reductoisomerase [Endomicrobium sp.]